PTVTTNPVGDDDDNAGDSQQQSSQQVDEDDGDEDEDDEDHRNQATHIKTSILGPPQNCCGFQLRQIFNSSTFTDKDKEFPIQGRDFSQHTLRPYVTPC